MRRGYLLKAPLLWSNLLLDQLPSPVNKHGPPEYFERMVGIEVAELCTLSTHEWVTHTAAHGALIPPLGKLVIVPPTTLFDPRLRISYITSAPYGQPPG